MKKIFLFVMSAGLLSFVSCNSKGSKDKDILIKDQSNEDIDEDTGSAFKKAAMNYCECINDIYADLDPAVKELMITSSHANDPAVSLSNEVKQKDEGERESLMSGLKEMSANPDAKDCSDRMLKDADMEKDDLDGLKKILKIAKANDECEFMAAVLRHSINTKERKIKREQDSEEE